jgi:CHASE2 domain-containing sensor protein
VQFLSACVLAFILEQAADRVVEATSHETSAVSQSIFDISGVYQRLVTTGPRRPISRYTTIIEIDPDPKLDPLVVRFRNLCRQRAFLAKLLQVVASAHPAIIVVDRYFDSSNCTADEAEKRYTAELVSALSSRAPPVPIVSGIDAAPVEGTRPKTFTPLAPTGQGLLYQLAIINLDADTRRLPLRWELNKKDDAEILDLTNDGLSLALQTAVQYDPLILTKNQRLREMQDLGQSPYINFLERDQFNHIYASEVLCMAQEKITHAAAAKCGDVKQRQAGPQKRTLLDLNHQIVVIGEAAREDNHNSIIGEVPGFYLQANYIEALLDDRVFRPVHPLVNYALGFLIFAIFEYILIKNLKKPFWAIVKVLALLVATTVVLYLAVVHSGYYLNPATVGLLAIFINLGHLAIARSEEHEEPQKELHHQQGC